MDTSVVHQYQNIKQHILKRIFLKQKSLITKECMIIKTQGTENTSFENRQHKKLYRLIIM